MLAAFLKQSFAVSTRYGALRFVGAVRHRLCGPVVGQSLGATRFPRWIGVGAQVTPQSFLVAILFKAALLLLYLPLFFVLGLAKAARWAASRTKPSASVPRRYDSTEWIDRFRIETIACANVNDPQFVERLRAMEIDLAIVAAYPQIFKAAILAVPRFGVVKYHPSLLPRYAGPQPAFWALRNGETTEVLRKTGRRFVVQAGDGSVEVTDYEIGTLHGWINALAQRLVPLVGDRFTQYSSQSD